MKKTALIILISILLFCTACVDQKLNGVAKSKIDSSSVTEILSENHAEPVFLYSIFGSDPYSCEWLFITEDGNVFYHDFTFQEIDQDYNSVNRDTVLNEFSNLESFEKVGEINSDEISEMAELIPKINLNSKIKETSSNVMDGTYYTLYAVYTHDDGTKEPILIYSDHSGHITDQNTDKNAKKIADWFNSVNF